MISRNIYENVIYKVIRPYITDSFNVDAFDKIIDVLLDTNLKKYDRASKLFLYFDSVCNKKTRNIFLVESDNIVNALEEYTKTLPFSNNTQIKNSNIGPVQISLLNYIVSNNTMHIEDERLLSVTLDEELTSDKITSLYNDVIDNPSISHILKFLLGTKLIGYAMTLKKNDDTYKELTLPITVWQAFNNPAYTDLLKFQTYIDNYKTLAGSEDDEQLFENIKETIDPNTDYTQNLDIQKGKKDYLNMFFTKCKFTMKKDDDNPLPVKEVNSVLKFLLSFSNDDNVDAVKNKINEQVYNEWNSKLIEALKDSINAVGYLKFFIDFNELETDEQLIDFARQLFNIDINLSMQNIKFNEPDFLLKKICQKQYKSLNKMSLQQFLDDIQNKGEYMTEEHFNKNKDKIRTIIEYMANILAGSTLANADINTLLRNPIYLDIQTKKQSISLKCLLETFVKPNNIQALKKMPASSLGYTKTDIDNMLQGVLYDIQKIAGNMKLKNIEISYTKAEDFFTALGKVFNGDAEGEINRINEFASKSGMWQKDTSGSEMINTLYQVFTNVTDTDNSLYALYATLIPNNFIKV